MKEDGTCTVFIDKESIEAMAGLKDCRARLHYGETLLMSVGISGLVDDWHLVDGSIVFDMCDPDTELTYTITVNLSDFLEVVENRHFSFSVD